MKTRHEISEIWDRMIEPFAAALKEAGIDGEIYSIQRMNPTSNDGRWLVTLAGGQEQIVFSDDYGGEWPQMVAVYDANAVYIAHATTGEGGDWIGDNPVGRERARANARLIASAPDLLADRDRLRAEVDNLRQGVEEANRWADSLQRQRDVLAGALEFLLERAEDWTRDSLMDFGKAPAVVQARKALRKAGRLP